MDVVELNRRIGEKIQALRRDKNISQFQLAVECGFEKSNMSRIESGKTNPTIGTLLKIADALDVELKDLVSF